MPKLVHSIKFMVHGLKKSMNYEPITINRKSAGFTLIEFLVVLGILTVTIGSTFLFLTSVLRGSNQGNVSAEVKQNGQSVLDGIDSQIRNSRNALFVTIPGASSAIRLTLANSQYLFLACANRIGTTSNGWIGSLGPQADGATPGTVGSFTSMTNKDTVAGVDVVCDPAGTFIVTSSSSTSTNPAIVKVGFLVNQGVAAPSRADFLANVRFDTTISLRQY